MLKNIEATGKTVEDAIENGLAELGLSRDDVTVEVLERPKSGFLGLGGTPAKVQLTYEFTQDKTTKTKNFIVGLLNRMNLSAEVDVSEKDDNHIAVELTGGDIGTLIGRHGDTLDALQYITSQVINRGEDKRLRITVDAQGYRKKREGTLIAQAQRVAEKAVKYKKNFTMEPMNSFERHVVHTALQEIEGITTSSVGSEPNRCVVVMSVEGGQPASISTSSNGRNNRFQNARGGRRPGAPRPRRNDN